MSTPSASRPRGLITGLTGALVLAALLRGLFPTADPPWRTTVGVVWHDEGAWTHNARNRALFGVWQTDNWNPLYIAPVFTALEYTSFATFGVGLWQARLVSIVAGCAAVLLLGLGVARMAGAAAGIMAALLLATNYVGLMYDRAAIMESLMAAFIVAGWWAFTRAQTAPAWGAAAGTFAVLAFFTKAAAIFFVAALVLTAVASLADAWRDRATDRTSARAAAWTLVGLVLAGIVALALFVGPSWVEYRFYNWQMSVTRKPSYDLASIVTRLSWFPILHDVLTRMWIVTAIGAFAWVIRLVAWTRLGAPERLLTLWIGIGVAELLFHDVGNERRFVFLIPALVALTALTLARDRAFLPSWVPTLSTGRALLAIPVVAYALYVVLGSFVRLAFLYEVRPAVRLSAAAALLALAAGWLGWRRLSPWLARPWPLGTATIVASLVALGGVVQFVQWASHRTYLNVEASRALGRLLPAGTLVHGKLANGLALENRIRPIFVGREFGNYADRLTRNDVPYVLSYIAPRLGYEGPVILDVLEAYPNRRIVETFAVAESPGGNDRAALIEKGPPAVPAPSLASPPNPPPAP